MSTALAKAHRRIADLERQIAARKAPARPFPLAPVAVGLAFFSLFALSTVSYRFIRRASPPVAPPVAVTAPAPAIASGPTVVPMRWNGPIAANIGGNDTEDLVLVFSHRDGSAEVAAIDGSTFAPLWRTPVGSFVDRRPHTFLRKVGDEAVLVDRDHVRAFDLKTGAPRGSWKTEVESWDFCPFENGEPRAYIERETFDHGALLDLEKRTLVDAPKKQATLGCHGRSDMPLCNHVNAIPCEGDRGKILGTTLSQSYAVYEDEETTATVGWTAKEQNAPYFGVFADKRTKQIIWEGRLSLPEDAGHEHDFRYAHAGGRVILTYVSAEAGRRVVAHDVKGGRVAWSTVVGERGSSLEGISGTKTRLYLSLDDRILIFDPDKGAQLRVVTSP